MQQIDNDYGLNFSRLQLSNKVRQLSMEHVLWTRHFILSTAFSLPNLQFVTERLLQNPGNFAIIQKTCYGEQAAMKFKELLTNHFLILSKLVNAAISGDTAQVDEQRRSWYENAGVIAKFLASINGFWSEAQWRGLLFDHLRLTENEVAYILTGQYENDIKEYDQIQTEALIMADVMSGGIIRQFNIK